jgi:hypothetical protein
MKRFAKDASEIGMAGMNAARRMGTRALKRTIFPILLGDLLLHSDLAVYRRCWRIQLGNCNRKSPPVVQSVVTRSRVACRAERLRVKRGETLLIQELDRNRRQEILNARG